MDVVAVAHRARPEISTISRDYFSRAIKAILPKIVFDFTAGRLSNAKILPDGSTMTFVCNKGTISLTIKNRIWAFLTINVISMCKTNEIFMKR